MGEGLTTARGEITIRAAREADAGALRALRLEALASEPEAFAADYARTEAEGIEAWVERIRNNEVGDGGVIYGAWAGDQLVGMTGLHRGHWPKTLHSGMIWGVYVKSAWRGQRIAEALLEACIAWAQGRGMTIVKLGVVTSNMGAIRCYARSGFAVYGIEPQTICYEGVFLDELLMTRTI